MSLNNEALINAFVSKLRAAGVPILAADNRASLDELEGKLPKRLPPSLESLLARFSFPTFDVCGISLFGWNSAKDNQYFAAASLLKGSLSGSLIPAGYMQIGRPDTGDFDAVCVDLNTKAQNREYRIVRLDHEEILCNSRVSLSNELWASFRGLIEHVVASTTSSGIYHRRDCDC